MQLPRIATFYGVTIDYLFYHEGKEQTIIHEQMPDDQVLRIVQFYGNKLLGAEEWQKDKSIDLIIPKEIERDSNRTINVTIWGNTNLEGDINGNVESGGNVNGGNIGGCVDCEGSINCGNVGGYADCGGDINCGNIGGHADCEGKLSCGNIGGSVEGSGEIRCGDINGNVTCDGNLTCHNIHGNVTCEGNIIYEK
jgi:hypothetical protein